MKKTLITGFVSLALVSSLMGQNKPVTVSDKPFAECEIVETRKDGTTILSCYGENDFSKSMEIPKDKWPSSWAKPGNRNFYYLAMGSDGKLYAIWTRPTACDPEQLRDMYINPSVNTCLPLFKKMK